jgi:hypothetical protein
MVILWPNHQTAATGFEAQTEKPKATGLRSNREKPSTLVLRPNQETRAPRLLVHGADRTQRHPNSQPSSQRVPNLCLTIPGPLHQVSTHATILVAARHVTPITYTPRDKQT